MTFTSGIIGGDAYFQGDMFFSGTALADTGATTSGEFLLAQTLGSSELKIMANGAVATGVGETLVVSVQTSATSGGSFTEVFSATIPASTTIADGEVVASYIAPREVEDIYTKVVITSDYDASALNVDGYTVLV